MRLHRRRSSALSDATKCGDPATQRRPTFVSGTGGIQTVTRDRRLRDRRHCVVLARIAVPQRRCGPQRVRLQWVRLVRLRPAWHSRPTNRDAAVHRGTRRGELGVARRRSGVLQHPITGCVARGDADRRRRIRARAEFGRRRTRRTDHREVLVVEIRRGEANAVARFATQRVPCAGWFVRR